ncbi:S-adenosyl-L-methionine-dependent methyltransferase [Amniculicola lignicola CBS 123094]|uniref:S-adenosyl-L-methionine-dependent methyltransferase n=1 Tax=Amniculicola lignicola CBS 123094 TaxID=1392246 RepID=A0A6A5W022_9PLEO|nr:S-adenosyl-L-methionine-dependent methyltransferase [Amniculicola lignicola CBS 123094]
MFAPGANDNDAESSSGPSLEIDTDNDRDSAFGGDNQSSYTMSVTDSVYNYKYENGRRYHSYAEGKYPVPNDEIEKDRLDLQHHAFRLTLDGDLYRAPIPKDLQHVLDVGTGTGIWAIEFADEHPSAAVIGTDLSPIQPTEVPPNCSFLIDDIEQEWIFHNKFDFIHTRAMVAAIKNWDAFFKQAYTNLAPGGFIECQEITFPAMCMDPAITSDMSPFLRWSDLFIEAAGKIGIDGKSAHKFGPKLQERGFTNIHSKTYKWPVGQWAKGGKMKLLGKFVFEDCMDWLPSSALGLFTRVLGWSREEVEVFLASVRKELKEEKHRHFYARVVVWYAQKPREAGTSDASAYDIAKEEESLESDEERTARFRRDEAAAAASAPESAKSPGALADTTADLSIASPPGEIPTEAIKEPAPTTEDSLVAASADQEMTTPGPEIPEETQPAQEESKPEETIEIPKTAEPSVTAPTDAAKTADTEAAKTASEVADTAAKIDA